ncbi:MAG: ATP-binding cassette domain-containing protein, partial [Candidatus Eremiobacteraeota bacterium]|nr:ATP-binding cassette domain-containing protein [Candidatus Eremiobacteraeota bacterium]
PSLRNLNIAVPARKTVAFVGPAGGGKTTLFKAINRLHDLNPKTRVTGTIKLDGADIMAPGTDVAALRRRAGMLFARPAIWPLSVFDNVALGLRARGMADRRQVEWRCEQALRDALVWERVRDVLARPAASLALDVQQQVCLARSLALDPDVLLFDDPTSCMETIAARRVEDVLARVRSHRTVLLATGDLHQAARLSDTACYVCGGDIVESGDTTSFFVRPADSRTEDFLAGRAS